MDEDLLEKLLKEKKDRIYRFDQSEEDFLAGFMEKIDHRPHRIHFWRYAAIFAAVIGITVPALTSMSGKTVPPSEITTHESVATNNAPGKSFDPMQESLRLFGDEVAVLFVGNDLVIGERMNTESPSNVLYVKLSNDIELKIACADNDSISVNAPGVSGNVIVSRSDRQTLVLDVDLLIQGKHINTQIPVNNGKDIRMHS